MIKTVTSGEITEIDRKELSDTLEKVIETNRHENILKDDRIKVLEATINVLLFSMKEIDNYKAMNNAEIVANFILSKN